MKKCLKCDNEVPKHIVVDGKKRNLQNRKYCLECSPFGKHNTRNLSDGNRVYKHKKICTGCGREFNANSRGKGTKCNSCYFNISQKRKRERVYSIVGYSCWHCGYDKGYDAIPVLEFHHVDPTIKKFCLSSRELVGNKWERVINEIKKCVLLCCRCHREIEHCIIEEDAIETIYREKWVEILEDAEKCKLMYGKYKRLNEKDPKLINTNPKPRPRKFDPSPLELEQTLQNNNWNYCAVGRHYNVSNNAIKKRCKMYNINK